MKACTYPLVIEKIHATKAPLFLQKHTRTEVYYGQG